MRVVAMERSGPERNGGGRFHGTRAGDHRVVRIDPVQAAALVDAYRHVGGALWDAGIALGPLIDQASDLLDQPVSVPAFAELGILLGRDADDLEWRVEFLRSTDGFDPSIAALRNVAPAPGWMHRDAKDLSFDQTAALLAHADNPGKLNRVIDWMFTTQGFFSVDPRLGNSTIPDEHRQLFAGALTTAYHDGWRPEHGELPLWLAAGMIAHGRLSDDAAIEFARAALSSRDSFGDPTTPNPFELDSTAGVFGPFAAHFVANPAVGRRFIDSLLDDFDRTGDTPLDMHHDGSHRTEQLAEIVVTAGTHGPVAERKQFVDRLVGTINADRDTNEPVFWATWAVHADLALEHSVTTTEPTFETHSFVPDSIRPAWEQTWHERVSPVALNAVFGFVQEKKHQAKLLDDAIHPGHTFVDWVTNRYARQTHGPGNDAGGTYTTRPKDNFDGMQVHVSDADRGRNIITHALLDSSDRGDIAQDEFAIIDHGIGANGKPTYTITLPGVIDLSNPAPGWDPQHASVRDMDQAALRSSSSTRVEDNLYAQMVIRALDVNQVPLGSNLLVVGHSFGADTAADLAANQEFTLLYNVTHVVAAGYDSAPQLAHISPDIDVLVLQNNDDKAILLESTQRRVAMSPESVSINTFAHEVREFDGGWGADIGHHQDRYITYLDRTDDAELTRFYESVAAMGYGSAGTSVAVDVTLDESLRSP